MEILVEKNGKKIELRFNGKGKLLLSRLGINPETVLLVKNGNLVTEDEMLKDKDKIKIISVISGG